MECALCKNQYIGKSEASFDIILNNGKDNKKSDVILARRHFQERNLILKKYAYI